MKRFFIFCFSVLTIYCAAQKITAQSPAVREGTAKVTVSGDACISAQPDTATVSVSVVTQKGSATEAQQRNAVETNAVLTAVRRTVGIGAEIKTSGYSLIPQRIYKENVPPVISGYEARNSITITLNDLTKVGAVIDAATAAGANNIDGIAFSLRNDREARDRALQEAAREARGKAAALAEALGGRLLRVLLIEEGGSTPRPVIYAEREAFATKIETPIEVGALEINSQVRLTAEIELTGTPR